MSEADLSTIKNAIKSTLHSRTKNNTMTLENKVCRDFFEIRNLSNPNIATEFAKHTLDILKDNFFDYFLRKKPNYSLYIKDGESNIVEGSKFAIYVNVIAGIKNFLHGVPYFCSTILVTEDNKAIAGLVNNYIENEMFYVLKNKGSFMNNQKIRVSNRTNIEDLLITLKLGKDKKESIKILEKLQNFKITNCSILDCCYTACGRYDANIILEGSEQDIELSKLFIEEAGGLNCQLSDNKNSFLFSTGNIFDKLKKIVM